MRFMRIRKTGYTSHRHGMIAANRNRNQSVLVGLSYFIRQFFAVLGYGRDALRASKRREVGVLKGLSEIRIPLYS
jgi:hypothetical protein